MTRRGSPEWESGTHGVEIGLVGMVQNVDSEVARKAHKYRIEEGAKRLDLKMEVARSQKVGDFVCFHPQHAIMCLFVCFCQLLEDRVLKVFFWRIVFHDRLAQSSHCVCGLLQEMEARLQEVEREKQVLQERIRVDAEAFERVRENDRKALMIDFRKEFNDMSVQHEARTRGLLLLRNFVRRFGLNTSLVESIESEAPCLELFLCSFFPLYIQSWSAITGNKWMSYAPNSFSC